MSHSDAMHLGDPKRVLGECRGGGEKEKGNSERPPNAGQEGSAAPCANERCKNKEKREKKRKRLPSSETLEENLTIFLGKENRWIADRRKRGKREWVLCHFWKKVRHRPGGRGGGSPAKKKRKRGGGLETFLWGGGKKLLPLSGGRRRGKKKKGTLSPIH